MCGEPYDDRLAPDDVCGTDSRAGAGAPDSAASAAAAEEGAAVAADAVPSEDGTSAAGDSVFWTAAL